MARGPKSPVAAVTAVVQVHHATTDPGVPSGRRPCLQCVRTGMRRGAVVVRPRARIAIAERWAVLRRGLNDVIAGAHQVVADVDDVVVLGRVLREQPVDLALIGDDASIDLSAVVELFSGAAIGVSVVVLCDDIDGDRLRELLRSGARAVISKKVDDGALLDDLDRALRGERVIDQRFLPLLFGTSEIVPSIAGERGLLTAREREVLAELARGSSNREIAATLLMGESTVKTHLGRIYSKLEVSGRHRAVGRAVELGLLT
jgi:DNA-binding NarL/FixJ family response regulator